MEDWKQRLVDAVRPYLDWGTSQSNARRVQMHNWLLGHGLRKVIDISTAQHAVELIELIDRWHAEDAANQPCSTPAPPTNPFIVEHIKREIKRCTIDDITIKGFNYHFVNIAINPGTYTPDAMRNLAKQLTDLADAHETIYPPAVLRADDL